MQEKRFPLTYQGDYVRKLGPAIQWVGRNARVVALHQLGYSSVAIARVMQLHRTRIRQIVRQNADFLRAMRRVNQTNI